MANRPLKWVWEWSIPLGSGTAALAGFLTSVIPPELKGYSGFVGMGGAILAILANHRVKAIEKREKNEQEERALSLSKRVAKAILDGIRETGFGEFNATNQHEHRVTLFKYAGDCLEIFARSGVHNGSKCSWPVNPNDKNACRGLAGEVWFTKSVRVRCTDKEYPADDNERDVAEYACSLGMTVPEAKSLNVKSKAFLGGIVEVNGRPWGVLLLDSRNPTAFTTNFSGRKKVLTRGAKLLGQALGEVL